MTCEAGGGPDRPITQSVLKRGIEILLETTAHKLALQEGRVVGAAVVQGGAGYYYARRVVVLATGGFEWDEALKATFLRGPLTSPASLRLTPAMA